MDSAPVLQFAEHVLDLVALAVKRLSCSIWIFLFDFEGMQASISRLGKASRNQSALLSTSARRALVGGSDDRMAAAPNIGANLARRQLPRRRTTADR